MLPNTLIFFRHEGPLHERIRELDGGNYSHVGLYAGSGTMVEAVPPMVRITRVADRAHGATDIAVYTLNRPVVRSYQTVLGRPYDWNWREGKSSATPAKLHCATLLGYLFGLEGPRSPDLSLSELLSFCEDRHG